MIRKPKSRLVARGEMLRKMRFRKGFTSRELSARVSISRAHLHNVEARKGGVSERTAIAIARELGCEVFGIFELISPASNTTPLPRPSQRQGSPKKSTPRLFGITELQRLLDMSRDQLYRRIRVLREARLLSPHRGRRNALMLEVADYATLREFSAIEQEYPEMSLLWCVEHLKVLRLKRDRS